MVYGLGFKVSGLGFDTSSNLPRKRGGERKIDRERGLLCVYTPEEAKLFPHAIGGVGRPVTLRATRGVFAHRFKPFP
jgi:hypothetical protein